MNSSEVLPEKKYFLLAVMNSCTMELQLKVKQNKYIIKVKVPKRSNPTTYFTSSTFDAGAMSDLMPTTGPLYNVVTHSTFA